MKKSNILFVLGVLVTMLFTLSSCYYEAIPTKPVRENIFTEEWYEAHKEDEKFELGTKEELKLLRDLVNKGEDFSGKTLTLVDDIDLALEEWVPIGSTVTDDNSIAFSGIIDGQGHSIKGINIVGQDQDHDVRAFISTMKSGEIKNLTLEGVATGKNNVAGFVGTVNGSASDTVKITNCINKIEITVSGKASAAGILCQSRVAKEVIIEGCRNEANISGTTDPGNSKIGGIVAMNYPDPHTIIKKCSNNGTLSGCDISGGIMGYLNRNVEINECTNTGSVEGKKWVGGVAAYICPNGSADTKIINCTNNGEVEGVASVGGIAGQVNCPTVSISGCINNGTIKNPTVVENFASCGTTGGIVGNLQKGKIENSTNNGAIEAYGSAGGVVGTAMEGEILGCDGGLASITVTHPFESMTTNNDSYYSIGYKGRIAGQVSNGSGQKFEITFKENDGDFSDGLASIGLINYGTNKTTLCVLGGVMTSLPKVGYHDNQTIIFSAGSSLKENEETRSFDSETKFISKRDSFDNNVVVGHWEEQK